MAYDEALAERIREAISVRVEPEDTAALLREPGVSEFGRPGSKPMTGFVIVDPGALDDAAFARWVDRGADRAASMPPK
ncbi:MAG TPA: hypothetical protein VFG79_02185 [Solirubrobacter sp.]|nr:hypothetical protein [Solirubrobacter sp.]